MTANLLIIDDDPEITSALVRGLKIHGYDASAENRADIGLERLVKEAFDCAIVDVMLGADSGIQLVETARKRGARIPIVMLSALSNVEDRAAGLAAGADDYIVKPFSFDELVARLKVQELRNQQDKPTQAALNLDQKYLTLGDARVELTEREMNLLNMLIQNSGAPVSRGDIFDALWAVDGSTSENVVDVYIGYLRRKLAGGEFGIEIKTVRNRGFMLDGILPKISGATT